MVVTTLSLACRQFAHALTVLYSTKFVQIWLQEHFMKINFTDRHSAGMHNYTYSSLISQSMGGRVIVPGTCNSANDDRDTTVIRSYFGTLKCVSWPGNDASWRAHPHKIHYFVSTIFMVGV